MRRIRHLVEAGLARTALVLFGALPARWAAVAGGWLGLAAHRLDRRHRTLARWNLSQSAVDRGSVGNRAVVRELYRHLGMMAGEFAHQARLRPHDLHEWVEIEGQVHLERALARGKGAVIVVAHFGNWELGGAVCALSGFPVRVVAFPQRNPRVDRLVNRIREASGMRVLPTGEAVRPLLRALRENAVVGVLADQDQAERGAFVPLLGRPASTAKGPAVLAARSGAALLTAFLHRVGPARHRLEYQPEIVVTGDAFADTRAWTRRLEGAVRAEPGQWLWVHDRWKSVQLGDGTVQRIRQPPAGWAA